MGKIDSVDIGGNLETIEHLAQIGQFLIAQHKNEHIPTILEDIFEHSQRLALVYAVKEDEDGTVWK